MKKFIVEEVLYNGKWFYDKKSKSYKQKTIFKAQYDTFKEAFENWKILHNNKKILNFRIICIERSECI
jgi:hypothetical protein